MSITTKTGDRGTTQLRNGEEVRKDCLRTELLGSIDELGCQLGLARALCGDGPPAGELLRLQRELIEVAGEIADPERVATAESDIDFGRRAAVYEGRIAQLELELPAVSEFRLPGASSLEAQLHLARAVSRRCERRAVKLQNEEEGLNANLLICFNRLADYLWLLARQAEMAAQSQSPKSGI